jgi:hypothetical protein
MCFSALRVNSEESFDEDVQFYVKPFEQAISPFISAIISQGGAICDDALLLGVPDG